MPIETQKSVSHMACLHSCLCNDARSGRGNASEWQWFPAIRTKEGPGNKALLRRYENTGDLDAFMGRSGAWMFADRRAEAADQFRGIQDISGAASAVIRYGHQGECRPRCSYRDPRMRMAGCQCIFAGPAPARASAKTAHRHPR